MSSQIDQIKQATDIVALISERVKLTRAGKNYKGLCPFHSEKSPSFFVTPELGRYKCFGCQESGDVFTFLEKMDALSFAQALQELAKRAGITLESIPFTQEDKKKDRLLSLLSLAREYYHYLLLSHDIGAPAREYLQGRGTHKSTVELFGMGFSPPSWDGIQKYLIGKKHFRLEELIDAGLVIKNEHGRVYDRFRGRLMFPLTTPRGQVVGFSGRLLEKDAKEAKYINSPETSLYHKSELLFGYSQLSSFIRKSEEVIVCEGEFDALSSMQAGVENVVAIKGSALTVPQITFLSRTVKRIILALDADSAGIEATKRAIQLIKESGADVALRVIPIAGGKDPDEIARDNPKQWREMVSSSVSVYEYLINVAFSQYDAETGDGKREISKMLSPLLASIENAVERAHYLGVTAKRLGVSEDVLLSELRKVKVAPSSTANMGPTSETKPTPPKTPATRKALLERYILLMLFASIAHGLEHTRSWIEQVKQRLIFPAPWSALLSAIWEERLSLDMAGIVARVPAELTESCTTLYLEASEMDPHLLTETEFSTALHEYHELVSKVSKKALIEEISQLENKDTLTTEEETRLTALRRQLI